MCSKRYTSAVGLQAANHLPEPIVRQKGSTAPAGQSGSNALFPRHAHIRTTLSLTQEDEIRRCKTTSLCTPCRRLNRTRNPGLSNHTQCFKASSQCNVCSLSDVTRDVPTYWLTVRSVQQGCLLWIHKPQLEYSETCHKPSVSAYAAKVFSELCDDTSCRNRNQD